MRLHKKEWKSTSCQTLSLKSMYSYSTKYKWGAISYAIQLTLVFWPSWVSFGSDSGDLLPPQGLHFLAAVGHKEDQDCDPPPPAFVVEMSFLFLIFGTTQYRQSELKRGLRWKGAQTQRKCFVGNVRVLHLLNCTSRLLAQTSYAILLVSLPHTHFFSLPHCFSPVSVSDTSLSCSWSGSWKRGGTESHWAEHMTGSPESTCCPKTHILTGKVGQLQPGLHCQAKEHGIGVIKQNLLHLRHVLYKWCWIVPSVSKV